MATAHGVNSSGQAHRTYVGLVRANVGEVRNVLDDNGGRVFSVYDTALDNNADHVDVFQYVRDIPSSAQKRLRKKLRDCFISSPLVQA